MNFVVTANPRPGRAAVPATVPATASVSPTAKKPSGCRAAARSPAQRHLAGPRDQKLPSPSTSAVSDSTGSAGVPAGTAPSWSGTEAAAGPARSAAGAGLRRSRHKLLPAPASGPLGFLPAQTRPPVRGPQRPHEPTAASSRQASALHHSATRRAPEGAAQTWPRLAGATGAAQTLPRTTLDPNCRFYKDGPWFCITRRRGRTGTCQALPSLPLRVHTVLCPAQVTCLASALTRV